MNYNNFTKTAQKALKTGADFAKKNKYSKIENAHLLYGIFETDKSVTPFILSKLRIDIYSFKDEVKKQASQTMAVATGKKMDVDEEVENALSRAKQEAKKIGDEYISVEHILTGILLESKIAKPFLKKETTPEAIREAVKELRKTVPSEPEKNPYEVLDTYAVNLNEKIKAGDIDPVIGRIDEIRRILQIISRRRKNNPVIIGEAGVGKTAIVEGLAWRIVRGDVPENLQNNIIYSLDLGSVIAGASKQGEFENRLKRIVEEVQQSAGEVILFIDEIHLLVGAGRSGGAMDAANILKPALARGELKAIGATTFNEYQKYFEKDKALVRRFQKVVVEEPSTEDTISILRGIKEKYQNFHGIHISDSAITAAVELSQRYLTDSFLPDKAIDLIDEAASKLRLEMNALPAEIDELERKINQFSVEKEILKEENNEKTANELKIKIEDLSDERTRLRAIWESEKALITKIATLREKNTELRKACEKAKEEGDFELAAKIQHKDILETDKELEKLNLELSENHSETPLFREKLEREIIAEIVSDVTGIPVSKMSSEETEKLINLEAELSKRLIGQADAVRAVSEAVRRSRAGLADDGKPIGSFIFLGTTGVGKTELAKALAEFLFDDEKAIVRIDMSEYMEKHASSRLVGASPGYVGYEEGGQLTEAVRLQPYSVVLLDEIEKAHRDVFNTFLQVLDDGRLTDGQGRTVNFKNTIIIMTSNAGADKILESIEGMNKNNYRQRMAKAKADVSKVLKEKMSPEFLNRIDEIIMFHPLSLRSIRKIAVLQINSLKRKLKKKEINLNVTELALTWLARAGYNPQFGARPVKRVIQKHILNELSDRILKQEVSKDKIINIDFKDAKLAFDNITPEALEKLKAEEAKAPEVDVPDVPEKGPKSESDSTESEENKAGFWGSIGNWFKRVFGKEKKESNEK